MGNNAVYNVANTKVSKSKIDGHHVLIRVFQKEITSKFNKESESILKLFGIRHEKKEYLINETISISKLLEINANLSAELTDDNKCKIFETICKCFNHEIDAINEINNINNNDHIIQITELIKDVLTVKQPTTFQFTFLQWIRFISIFENFIKYGSGTRKNMHVDGLKTDCCYTRYLYCCNNISRTEKKNKQEPSIKKIIKDNNNNDNTNEALTNTDDNNEIKKRQHEFKQYETIENQPKRFKTSSILKSHGSGPIMNSNNNKPLKFNRLTKSEIRSILFDKPPMFDEDSKEKCQISYKVIYNFTQETVSLNVYSKDPNSIISASNSKSQSIYLLSHSHNFDFRNKNYGLLPIKKPSLLASSIRNSIFKIIIDSKQCELIDIYQSLKLIYGYKKLRKKTNTQFSNRSTYSNPKYEELLKFGDHGVKLLLKCLLGLNISSMIKRYFPEFKIANKGKRFSLDSRYLMKENEEDSIR